MSQTPNIHTANVNLRRDLVRDLAIRLNDAKLDAHSANWRELAADLITAAADIDAPIARSIARTHDAGSFRIACAEAVLDLHRNHPGVLG